jgi:hypothetical protein
MVFLDEANRDAVPLERVLAKYFGKEPASIAVANRGDDFDIGDVGAGDLHAFVPELLGSAAARRRRGRAF